MTSQFIYEMTDEWTDGGVNVAIEIDVTDTSSDAASLLIDLQIGGVSKFSVDKSGGIDSDNISFVSSVGTPVNGLKASGTLQLQLFASSNIAMKVQQNLVQVTSGLLEMGHSGASTRFGHPARDELLQFRGANQQTLGAAIIYTDESNYERTVIENGVRQQSVGTGAADIDLPLVPAGTGLVKFGARTAIGAETVTGYLEIKDAGGTTRKLAVVS